MKRKLLLISSFVLGTLALTTSCSNDSLEQTTPAAKEVTINFGANVGEDTRTVYDPAATVKVAWQTGDKVRLYDGTSKKTLTVSTVNSDGTTAFSYATTVGSHTFTALYPLSADIDISSSTKLKIELPNAQTYVAPTATTEGSFDPAADILFAKSIDVDVTEAAAQNIPLVFTRPLAVCQFALKIDDATVNSLDGDKIQSVKISVEATNTKYLTGRFYEKLEDGTIVDATNGIFYYGYKSYVDLTPDNSDNAVLKIGKPIAVWAVIAPVALESGDKLVFDIVTDKNTIKKEITIGVSGLEFYAGKRNIATINLRNATIGNVADAVSVTPESLSWAADATDAKTVTVTSSGAWTASIDNTAEFTLSATSGVNGGTFTVEPNAANTTATEKTATVTLTCGIATATVTCTQSGNILTTETSFSNANSDWTVNDNGGTKYWKIFKDNYVLSPSIDLSKLIKVEIQMGTFGGSDGKTLSIQDENGNVWATQDATSSTQSTKYTITGSGLSGSGKLKFVSQGSTTSIGLRILSVKIYYTN